jgi:hypothetical protein
MSTLRTSSLFCLALLSSLLMIACGPREQAEGDNAAVDSMLAAENAGLPMTITGAGLDTPESVLYDSIADVYLVSNIGGGGDPIAKDDNGFIARIKPDGQVETLRWIDGASDSVTLNGPKGLAIHGDTLFVADIDSIRSFNRTSGATIGVRGVPGATFLNDLTIGDDGRLYVTDSGLGAGMAPNGSDGIYRMGANGASPLVSGSTLMNPNGIQVHEGEVFFAPYGSKALMRIPSGGAPAQVVELPAGQLDGLVRLPDGSFLVSSWESSSVYRVRPDSTIETAADNVTSPADIGYDSKRHRLLIPLFTTSAVEIRAVP